VMINTHRVVIEYAVRRSLDIHLTEAICLLVIFIVLVSTVHDLELINTDEAGDIKAIGLIQLMEELVVYLIGQRTAHGNLVYI